MASVTLENVSKSYPSRKGAVCAVRGFNLDIRDGEFVVLVGPSGCGKTTTLRMIAGLEEISGGVIRIGGRVVNDVQPKDRDVAMVFQNYALYPHMTVYDNLAFALKIRRMPKADIRARVHEVAEMLHIAGLLDRRPKDLSGGERQRVAVGRAIVRRPSVFLFDEPLSNLDARLRLHTRTELKALHQRLGTTCIYVTHDQEEAMTLGERLVLMRDGVIQQSGPPMELYTRPVNRFAASFIGSPGMNFLQATREDGRWRLTAGGTWRRDPEPSSEAALVEVELAFRPEHVRLQGDGGTPARANHGALCFSGNVTVVEPLGETMNVHIALSSGESVIARVPPISSASPGSPVTASVEGERVHIFDDREDGARR